MNSSDAAALRDRYLAIRNRISAEVTLIAVSKFQSVDAIESLYRLGHRDFGENYAQELAKKAEELRARGCEDIRWHFIGHLQTNKAKTIVPYVSAVHTVDSEKLARELVKRWEAADRKGALPVFIEVDMGDEETKAGVPFDETPALAKTLAGIAGIEVLGLMCIPSPDAAQTGEPFRRLRDLESRCRPTTQGRLSMGMTDDFELAIREGATHVRIGTAIFGARPAQSAGV